MPYDPPPDEDYAEAYSLGYNAAKNGLDEDDNPYKASGHERDTTFEDELRYQWYAGFWDFSD